MVPALGRQGGVVVVFSDRFVGEISSWKRDSEGRITSVLVSFGSFSCNLVNVYAPTNRLDHSAFFRSVHQFFFPDSRLILGGYLNCYDIVLDMFGGTVSLSSDLSSFKSCFNLIDAWRSKHPRVSQCSWFNSDMSIGSRLDSFLVVRELISSLVSCKISPVCSPITIMSPWMLICHRSLILGLVCGNLIILCWRIGFIALLSLI